jgi:cytoskeletal protein CcmA (bactofilin family)
MWKRDASPKPVNTPMEPAPAVPAAPAAASPAPRPVEPRQVERVESHAAMSLGKSVMIKGELSASEDLTLHGQMEGHVTVPDHTVTVGPEADVRADIKAATVVIMGIVSGSVNATRKVEVKSTGSLTGDITSPSIVIDDGGQFVGKVQMTTGRSQGVRRTA